MIPVVSPPSLLLSFTSLIAFGACDSRPNDLDEAETISAVSSAACPKTIRISDRQLVTFIDVQEVGCAAVKIWLPEENRFASGAPIVVQTPTSFTPSAYRSGFGEGLDATAIGAINLAFLLPRRV